MLLARFYFEILQRYTLSEKGMNIFIDPVYDFVNFVIEAKFRLQLPHLHATDLLS